MKPTTSSKTGLFTTILFAAATACAMVSMTGCAAPTAADEESATSSSDHLDGEEVEKVEYDPGMADELAKIEHDKGSPIGNAPAGDHTPQANRQRAQ